MYVLLSLEIYVGIFFAKTFFFFKVIFPFFLETVFDDVNWERRKKVSENILSRRGFSRFWLSSLSWQFFPNVFSPACFSSAKRGKKRSEHLPSYVDREGEKHTHTHRRHVYIRTCLLHRAQNESYMRKSFVNSVCRKLNIVFPVAKTLSTSFMCILSFFLFPLSFRKILTNFFSSFASLYPRRFLITAFRAEGSKATLCNEAAVQFACVWI